MQQIRNTGYPAAKVVAIIAIPVLCLLIPCLLLTCLILGGIVIMNALGYASIPMGIGVIMFEGILQWIVVGVMCVFFVSLRSADLMNKDYNNRLAYKVLITLVVLAVLLFITRLWVLLFLVIPGILIAALRLLFKRVQKTEIISPLVVPEAEPRPETEKAPRPGLRLDTLPSRTWLHRAGHKDTASLRAYRLQ